MKRRHLVLLLLLVGLLWALPAQAADTLAAEGEGAGLLVDIGISILAATIMAYLAYLTKQPLLLAYIAAGVVIGPRIGLGLVSSQENIQVIAEIGLILLLFMIGLEIDLRQLLAAGSSLIVSGVSQFILCAALGVAFLAAVGYGMGQGNYDLVYFAACAALSSTAIVVKLLYGKLELTTLAGRLTLGILVFQDLWAIVLLGIQPNLDQPEILPILLSFAKSGLLVLVAFLLARYLLPPFFRSIAKIPEVMFVASLGWCFMIAALANLLGLSMEMGALIAGVAISSFPYSLDVVSKVLSVRDFFMTLFFVALGMGVPNPVENLPVLGMAAVMSVFLVVSRFLAVYPVLHLLRNGNRISLLTSINLAQMSEFSLVIATIGLQLGHISQNTLSAVIFVFVITAIASTYLIKYSQPIAARLAVALGRLGLKEVGQGALEPGGEHASKEIAILGFFQVASSLVNDITSDADDDGAVHELSDRIMVVDFNPQVYERLTAQGIKVVYGDISHADMLHHVGIEEARLVISTVPDSILVGTDNLKLTQQLLKLCPGAKIIVNAETHKAALAMYEAGADYVYLPRLLAAEHLHEMIRFVLAGGNMVDVREKEIARLQQRQEVVA